MMLSLHMAAAQSECDLIQYRRGLAPWLAWDTIPEPPEGFEARGPWVCVAQLPDGAPDEAWLWARGLDFDPEVARRAEREAEERRERAKQEKERALAAAESVIVARGLKSLALAARFDGLPGASLAEAAEAGDRAMAHEALMRVPIAPLRAFGHTVGIRKAAKDRLADAIIWRFVEEARESGCAGGSDA